MLHERLSHAMHRLGSLSMYDTVCLRQITSLRRLSTCRPAKAGLGESLTDCAIHVALTDRVRRVRLRSNERLGLCACMTCREVGRLISAEHDGARDIHILTPPMPLLAIGHCGSLSVVSRAPPGEGSEPYPSATLVGKIGRICEQITADCNRLNSIAEGWPKVMLNRGGPRCAFALHSLALLIRISKPSIAVSCSQNTHCMPL
jgi:hypothetical protein